MKRLLTFLFVFIALGAGFFFFKPHSESDEHVIVSESVQTILEKEEARTEELVPEDHSIEPVEEPEPLQEDNVVESLLVEPEVLLDLPFIVQAPNANWDLPYSEACEEASLLMVHHYYQGNTTFTQDEMQAEIDSIIFWGEETFGSFDTNAQTTTRYLTEKLGYDASQVTVVYDFTIDDIKALLSKGIPVVVPAAGRELGNKFFQDPGPLYHMLVITGYTDDEFITNDPGTRRGEGYRYKQEVLYNAIHDLTPDLEQITTGQKAMIIIQQ